MIKHYIAMAPSALNKFDCALHRRQITLQKGSLLNGHFYWGRHQVGEVRWCLVGASEVPPRPHHCKRFEFPEKKKCSINSINY